MEAIPGAIRPPDVLRFVDTELPEIGSQDVLVRVHAAAPDHHNWHNVRGDPRGDPYAPAARPCRDGRLGSRRYTGRRVRTQLGPGDDPRRAPVERRGLGAVGEPHDDSPVCPAARTHDSDLAPLPVPGRPDQGEAEVCADDVGGQDRLPGGQIGRRDDGHRNLLGIEPTGRPPQVLVLPRGAAVVVRTRVRLCAQRLTDVDPLR